MEHLWQVVCLLDDGRIAFADFRQSRLRFLATGNEKSVLLCELLVGFQTANRCKAMLGQKRDYSEI